LGLNLSVFILPNRWQKLNLKFDFQSRQQSLAVARAGQNEASQTAQTAAKVQSKVSGPLVGGLFGIF